MLTNKLFQRTFQRSAGTIYWEVDILLLSYYDTNDTIDTIGKLIIDNIFLIRKFLISFNQRVHHIVRYLIVRGKSEYTNTSWSIILIHIKIRLHYNDSNIF